MMKALLLAGVGALALVACTEEKAPAPTAATPAAEEPTLQVASAPQVPAVEAQVNWEAARADMAKRPSDVVVPQAAGTDPLTVPMLLPVIVQTASDRPVPPRITKDGYFATYHLPRYDVIVDGSMKAYAAGAQTPAATDKSEMKFQTSEGSAQLAFSRYGADYLIEFECREIDSPEGCITEAQAKEFAESLFVAQSR
jgi:hypothetical protein